MTFERLLSFLESMEFDDCKIGMHRKNLIEGEERRRDEKTTLLFH